MKQKNLNEINLNKIKKDLIYLKNFEVVLYGSFIEGNTTPRSDIDIAIISRKTNPVKNIDIWKNALKKSKTIYHLNVFELLPLNLKAEIIAKHLTVFGDEVELSEYFYHFRKLWEDSKHRYYENQFTSFKEKINKIKAATN